MPRAGIMFLSTRGLAPFKESEMSAQYSSHVTQEDLFDLAAYRHVDTCPNCGKTCPAANYYEGRVCHVCYNEDREFYWLWSGFEGWREFC